MGSDGKALIPRIFEGRTVAIVAGGPSIRGFDWRRLERARCIAINRAYETLPFARVLYWGDASFFRKHIDGLHAHGCIYKATVHLNYLAGEIPEWVQTYRVTGGHGFDDRADCLRHGNNSAYAAMHIAVHLGAKNLVLFGVDMKHGPNGETHWHDGHGVLHEEATLTNSMRPFFADLVKPLADRGVTVINASPDSALTDWPRVSIDEGVGLACADSNSAD